MLEIINKDYFETVKEFAKVSGLEDNLKEQLDYLDTYACSEEEPNKTKCVLYKDFAPYSFQFTMHREQKIRRHECICGSKWESPSNEEPSYCPACGCQSTCSGLIEEKYVHWFNGGLIFFNVGESGGFPQLTCRLDTSTRGWSIHT